MPGYTWSRCSRISLRVATCLALGWTLLPVGAQIVSEPFAYPGMPTTPYGPDWQSYFEVTDPLPNVTWPMPRSFAGSVSVDRQNHPDNSLFFFAFEREDGSLRAADRERTDEPWVIWLNGGPGSSSMYGLFQELGPIRIGLNDQPSENPWSWHKLADIFFVDQPVGTGFSTVDATGFVPDEDQMGEDFARFLANIISIFPSLKNRPLYLTGESYAGTYIPYISKTLFSMNDPPVKPAKIAIGNGAIGSVAAFEEFPIMTIIDTYPQLINFDTKVYDYFAEQFTLCGFNVTFSYPETRKFPSFKMLGNFYYGGSRTKQTSKKLKELIALFDEAGRQGFNLPKVALERRQGNSYPVPALTGKIDKWYGCWLVEELLDFAYNYTAPWTSSVNIYDMADALSPPAPDDPAGFLNNPVVATAIHAPKKTYRTSIPYPFGAATNGAAASSNDNLWGDPSPEPMVFFNELSKNVSIVLFSGNNDALVSHRGTELVIQNTTFGGIQGFTKRPQTPFTDDEGTFAGIVHQERNITYALFTGAGHMVPAGRPKAAFAFLREFILGTNTTGLVLSNGTVVGGEDPAYFSGIIQGKEVHVGKYSTTATTTWPASAWSVWDAFVATRTNAVDAINTHSSSNNGNNNSANNNNGNGNQGNGVIATRSPLTALILGTLAALFGSVAL